MNLINHQNDVAALLDLGNQTLHAALKLTTELRAGYQCRQIQQKYFLVPELIRHFPGGNPLGQALSDGSLTDTGLTNQAGVVLLPTVQNLDDSLGLNIPTNHLIQLAGPGPGGQIHAVTVQEFMLFVLLFLRLLPFRLVLRGTVGLLGRQIRAAAKELVQQRERGSLAFGLIIIAIVIVVALAEHAAHLITEQIQVFFRNAHLLHSLVNLRDSQTPGAFQAIAFIHRHAVFHLGDEYHGDIFLTFAAHFRLHLITPLQENILSGTF